MALFLPETPFISPKTCISVLFTPLLLLISVLLFFIGIVYREKFRFRRYGVDLQFQQAVNVFIRGGFRQDIAEAAKLSEKLRQPVPVEKLQIHAASGGNPMQVVQAMKYLEQTEIESLKVGFRHICLIDLSGKPLTQVIEEAEQILGLKLSGEFEFSGMEYHYLYQASYRRPLMSVAFDSFSGEPVRKEIKRKITDLSRYHKELLRMKAGDEAQLRKLILDNVLRKAFWEQNFKLILLEHDIVISRSPMD
ncbi:MAG: hypothetical protein JJU35_08120 [Balneolales bacterium]|nr:hypothetical protein [Balneolales bacterium]